jgi:hypothetical protein
MFVTDDAERDPGPASVKLRALVQTITIDNSFLIPYVHRVTRTVFDHKRKPIGMEPCFKGAQRP